ncbi:DUF6266 family protein [Parapedobacter sp. DT-150]|uniref:DUF6266 family protein n=1 Tax=Parapedobacter sp. DT-150 TaxID=3396162 RepID=UPI003F1CA4FA
MGIIEEGINGPFRGKAGSVIGSSWRKINYIKGLPRKKKREPTPEQALQRRKFALLNAFLRDYARVLEIGFGQYTSRATGVNAAFRFNYDHAFLGEGDDLMLDTPALKLSHGSLAAAGLESAWLEGNTLHVAWHPKTYGINGSADDTAYILVRHTIGRVTGNNSITGLRHEGSAQHHFKDLQERGYSEFHVWLFFADREGKRVSKTVYIPLENSTPNT